MSDPKLCGLCGTTLTEDDGIKLCGTCLARKPDLTLRDLGATATDSMGCLVPEPTCPICNTKILDGLCEHVVITGYDHGRYEDSDVVKVETISFVPCRPNKNGDVFPDLQKRPCTFCGGTGLKDGISCLECKGSGGTLVKTLGFKHLEHSNKPLALGKIESWKPSTEKPPTRVWEIKTFKK